MKIETLEIAGLVGTLEALRLPFKLKPRSELYFSYNATEVYFDSNTSCEIHPKDLILLQTLVKNGDEHAKVLRGIEVWVKMEMPLYFMIEFDTYRIGIDTLATSSSMHTDCKGLHGESLQKVKGEIKGDYIYTRVFKVNYQTLRRIYLQRNEHRLLNWKEFCNWIKTLPLANKLILIK